MFPFSYAEPPLTLDECDQIRKMSQTGLSCPDWLKAGDISVIRRELKNMMDIDAKPSSAPVCFVCLRAWAKN